MQLTAFLLCQRIDRTDGLVSLVNLAESGAFGSPDAVLPLDLYVEFFVAAEDVGQLVEVLVLHAPPGQEARPFGAAGGTLVVPQVKDGTIPVWSLEYHLTFAPRWLGRHHFVLSVDGQELARRAFDVHQD